MLKKIIILFIVLLSISCSIQLNLPTGDWTIMFYLGAEYGNPINLQGDISNIVKKSENTSNIRVIILYDGPSSGDSKLEIFDSKFSYNSREVELNGTDIPTISDNEFDMGSENTLTSFIKYSKEKSPAKNYALYFGSHGTGFNNGILSGLGVERDGTILEISEIKNSIEANNGVDLLVFDACDIGNIETLYELRNSAKYIIASPEEVIGNDYRNLINSIYNSPPTSPKDLGIKTLNSHYDYFNNHGEPDNNGKEDQKDRLNLYETAEIERIVAESFNDNYFDIIKDDNNITASFQYGVYKELNAIDNRFESAITTADNSILKLKWLSIYYPTVGYNSAYEKTDFAEEFPYWVNKIKPIIP